MSESIPVNTSPLLQELCDRACDEFQSRFGRAASVVVAAPGRVNLIGEHIDYNDGFVLPMAIERYVVIAADPKAGGKTIDLWSANLEESAEIDIDQPLTPGETGWSKYPQGVIAGFAALGDPVPAFDAVFASDVPVGGGLSSSAALEVATATLMERLRGGGLTPIEKALLCQKAEHEFAGVPCGIMDQFSSVFGKSGEFMLLDCCSQEIQTVPFARDDVSILITNCNVKHELTGGEYAQRRSQCDAALKTIGAASWRDVTPAALESSRGDLDDTLYRRALHVVTEIARTTETSAALIAGDLATVGKNMVASHESLRDDYEVSCPELDLLVELAMQIGAEGGVYGSRMTGGGFGGCTVTLVDAAKAAQVAEAIGEAYRKKIGKTADAFASRPALGAHVIR